GWRAGQRDPYFSWRVGLLPFIEEDNLYKSLSLLTDHFQTPRAQLAKAPPPGLDKLMKTAVPLYTLPRHKKEPAKTIFRRVVVKGQENPFIVVESADLVDWAKTGDEITIAAGKPLPKLRGHFPGGILALCGDGRVRFLPRSLGKQALLDALTTGKGV